MDNIFTAVQTGLSDMSGQAMTAIGAVVVVGIGIFGAIYGIRLVKRAFKTIAG